MTLFKVKMRIRNSTTMTVDNISCLSIPILDVVPPKKNNGKWYGYFEIKNFFCNGFITVFECLKI